MVYHSLAYGDNDVKNQLKRPFKTIGKPGTIRESIQASGVHKIITRSTMYEKAQFCWPELALGKLVM